MLPSAELWRTLRRRAEEHPPAVAPENLSADEAQALVQELQTHQLELEMQYEELLLAQTAAETARAAAEQARAEFADLYECAPVAYVTLNAAGAVERANQRACDLLGFGLAQVVGRRMAVFVAPASREAFAGLLQQLAAAAGPLAAELDLLADDGRAVAVRVEGQAGPAHSGGQGRPFRLALLDVRERAAAAAALLQSQERTRLALAASRAGVVEWDCTTHEVFLDEHARTLFGLPGPAGHLPLAALQAQVLPADHALLATTLDQALPGYALDLEFRVATADLAQVRYLAAHCQLVVEETTGIRRHLTGLVRDITARRTAEEELGYKNRLLAHILHHTPVLVGQLAPNGDYLELVGAGLRRLGLADNALVGTNVFDSFPAMAAPVRRLLAGEAVSFVGTAEHNGRPVYFQNYGFFDAVRQRAVVLALDITELHELHEEAADLRLAQQRAVFEAVQHTQEEERRRMAETLHNGVGQLLYLMRLHLENGPGGAAFPPRAALSLLDEAIRDVRAVSAELVPPVLESLGLKTALEAMAKRVPGSLLRVRCNFQGLDAALPRPLETAIYRMVQELLNNVLRHAGAEEVFLHVVREPGSMAISVDDDGRGYDLAAPGKTQPGVGLASIRTQVALLGGQLRVLSQPGRGTAASIELPL